MLHASHSGGSYHRAGAAERNSVDINTTNLILSLRHTNLAMVDRLPVLLSDHNHAGVTIADWRCERELRGYFLSPGTAGFRMKLDALALELKVYL